MVVIPRLQTLLIRLRVKWLQRASFANSYKCLYIMTGNLVPLTQHKALCVTELMTCYLRTRRSIPFYNRRLNAEHHSSMPFPISYFIHSSFSFYRIVFRSLFLTHSSFHHSSFLTSTTLINYFISVLRAFAFA